MDAADAYAADARANARAEAGGVFVGVVVVFGVFAALRDSDVFERRGGARDGVGERVDDGASNARAPRASSKGDGRVMAIARDPRERVRRDGEREERRLRRVALAPRHEQPPREGSAGDGADRRLER